MIADAKRPPNNLAGYDPVATAPPDCHYDPFLAELAVSWIEQECVHIEGRRFVDKPFILEPWQADIQRTVYGWRRVDGRLRYNRVYEEVPRKNGKSMKLAANVLMNCFCPHFAEPGSQLFSAGGDLIQAGVVFRLATGMIRRNRLMSKRCKIRDSQKRVRFGDSYYRAVASGVGKFHGTNPQFVAADELHVWQGEKGRMMFNEFVTGMGNRDNPLMWMITTAGWDRQSVCWEQHEYARRVRKGEVDDGYFLPILYFADEHADWTDPQVWREANPNYGVSIREDFLRQECERAKVEPLYENTFRMWYLNQWVEQAVRWMPMELWRASPPGCPDDELLGQECYGGLDIASTRDLASFVLVFPRDEGYRIKCWFFCPQEAVSRRAKADQAGFAGWVGKHIEATPGNSINQERIREVMWECRDRYDLRSVGFDPWNMDECYQTLIREGWSESELLKVSQNYASYNEPMQKCLELVKEKRLHHGGNPVLEWNAANVVAKVDPSGNIRPDKGASQEKIDGFCAMLMALSEATVGEGKSIYETEGEMRW